MQTRAPWCLSWANIRASWEAVWNKPHSSWKSCRGPIGAMFLSLKRLDWKMLDPLTMVDDCGVYIPLLLTSPALLKKF